MLNALLGVADMVLDSFELIWIGELNDEADWLDALMLKAAYLGTALLAAKIGV